MNLEQALKLFEYNDLSSISKDELKKKYKRLMIKYHPDNCGGNEEKAKDISTANKLILDALYEIEQYENLIKASNQVVITTVLPFSTMFDLYKGKTIKIGAEEDKFELNKNNMLKHNVFFMFNWSVTYNNITENYNKLRHIEMLRKYEVDCDIKVNDLGPLEIEVSILDQKRKFVINYDSISIPIKFDSDIKVVITLRKVLVSE